MNAKFNVGDEVEIISNGSTGTIKEITSYVNNGDLVYMVDVKGKVKAYLESNIRLVRKINML